jgi:hypothetical protein
MRRRTGRPDAARSGTLNPAPLRHALSVTTIDRLIFPTD